MKKNTFNNNENFDFDENDELNENIEFDEFEDDDDYIAQGYGPNDYARTMGLYDDEDGWCNDDGNFLGHDCFD